MVTFILQKDGAVLVDLCKPTRGLLCGIITEEGNFRIFKRYFEERRFPEFSSDELYMIALKAEEVARAFQERLEDLEEVSAPVPRNWFEEE